MDDPTDPLGVADPDDGAGAAKRELRRQVVARRDAMAGAQRLAAGAALRARLTALPPLTAARTVLCFASFRTEVDTAPLVAHLLGRGVTVALPRMIGPRHIEAFAVTDPAADLVPGRYDIPEPREGLPVVEPAAVDVVIVPGSAFDTRGGRLGYGGGFYDAFLARTRPDTRRIGICFELQVVPRVPREPHDLCVDVVVTERRVIETGCRRDGNRT